MDYSGRSKLESKINRQCKEDCQKEKKKVEDDLSKIGEKGDEIFSMEEDKVNEEIDDIDKVAGAFDSLSEMEVEEAEDDAAAAEAASSMNQNFQNQLLKANIKDKDELKEKADEAAKKDPKNFKRVVSAHIFSKRATALAKEKKLNSRKIAFKATIGKAKSGLKSVGSMDNAAKASVALGGGLRGISKIMAGTKDGDVDPKAIAMGVLDVVDGLSAFLPSPASVITGKLLPSPNCLMYSSKLRFFCLHPLLKVLFLQLLECSLEVVDQQLKRSSWKNLRSKRNSSKNNLPSKKNCSKI